MVVVERVFCKRRVAIDLLPTIVPAFSRNFWRGAVFFLPLELLEPVTFCAGQVIALPMIHLFAFNPIQ